MHKKAHKKHSNRIHIFRIVKQCQCHRQCPTKPSEDLGHLDQQEFNQQILPHETPSISMTVRITGLPPFNPLETAMGFSLFGTSITWAMVVQSLAQQWKRSERDRAGHGHRSRPADLAQGSWSAKPAMT